MKKDPEMVDALLAASYATERDGMEIPPVPGPGPSPVRATARQVGVGVSLALGAFLLLVLPLSIGRPLPKGTISLRDLYGSTLVQAVLKAVQHDIGSIHSPERSDS